MQPDPRTDAVPVNQPKLDHARLFGFRNVVCVTDQESDVGESADLAFTKRGTEFVG